MLTTEVIRRAVKPLAEKYGIVKVDLFGSYANGNATEKSDADFLVAFDVKIPSIFKVMGFKQELEDHLGYPVDVVTLPAARPGMLNIEKAVNVYERA
ncbi:MAG: nucleotidyltransferase domain-containing protein [Firmicutes bacterium]|nr:nucleotidyltransferase domain-containing protein [Bacillota bacterium]